MHLILWAALGGGLGAALRFAISGAIAAMVGPAFPWGTLAVNAIGGLAMGALTAKVGHDPVAMAFWGAGVLGGFTTFSAFSLETLRLVERGAVGLAGAYILASVALAVGGAGFGHALAKAWS